MIHCLIGQSSSGKSTIERELTKKGLKRIISYTTRPMRDGEVNGVDYHFVDEEEFSLLKSMNFFNETANYREWHYGLSLANVDYIEEDWIAVVTIHGYMSLRDSVGSEHINIFHIHVPERVRIIRQLNRGDEVDEVFRRIHTDREDFFGVEELADFVIENIWVDSSVEKIYNIIKC